MTQQKKKPGRPRKVQPEKTGEKDPLQTLADLQGSLHSFFGGGTIISDELKIQTLLIAILKELEKLNNK